MQACSEAAFENEIILVYNEKSFIQEQGEEGSERNILKIEIKNTALRRKEINK